MMVMGISMSGSAIDLGIRNGVGSRQTGSRQSSPRRYGPRYGNPVSTPGATRPGKNKQNSLQKRGGYGISVSTPGWVSNGGFCRSGTVRHFYPFSSLCGTFPSSPGCFPIFSRILPIGPFPLSGPVESTYMEHSQMGPRHNQDLSKNVGIAPGLEAPSVGFFPSLKASLHLPTNVMTLSDKWTPPPKIKNPALSVLPTSRPQ